MYGKELGEMAWMDLSVDDAEAVSCFYQRVIGWNSDKMAMTADDESYNDYVMTSSTELNDLEKTTDNNTDESSKEASGEAPTSPKNPQSLVTGICHAKGENKDMPAAWLPYFLVKDIDESAVKIVENGGSLVTKIKNVGADRYVVFKDPAGAMAAIYQKAHQR